MYQKLFSTQNARFQHNCMFKPQTFYLDKHDPQDLLSLLYCLCSYDQYY